ncbi:MAG: hypothetical protein R3B47_14815 [Bacteroidia bacterium]
MIHPDDALKHFIADGDMVCLESPRGRWMYLCTLPMR